MGDVVILTTLNKYSIFTSNTSIYDISIDGYNDIVDIKILLSKIKSDNREGIELYNREGVWETDTSDLSTGEYFIGIYYKSKLIEYHPIYLYNLNTSANIPIKLEHIKKSLEASDLPNGLVLDIPTDKRGYMDTISLNNPDSITDNFTDYIMTKNGESVNELSIGVGEEASILNHKPSYIESIGFKFKYTPSGLDLSILDENRNLIGHINDNNYNKVELPLNYEGLKELIIVNNNTEEGAVCEVDGYIGRADEIPAFISPEINNYRILEYSNDIIKPIKNVPYTRINKNTNIASHVNSYSGGLNTNKFGILMGGFKDNLDYTLTLKFGANKAPVIEMDNIFEAHDEEITIKVKTYDPDGDRYKINWSLSKSDGTSIYNRSVGLQDRHPELIEVLRPGIDIPLEDGVSVDFVFTVIAEDEMGLSNTSTATITIVNNVPILVVENNPKYVKVTVSDPDLDGIRGTILANPKTADERALTTIHSEKGTKSKDIFYYYVPGDLIQGKNNTVVITIWDTFFGSATKTINVIGEHRSLMFYDDMNNLYTDDLGEAIQYMDFGTLTAGQTSDPMRVKLVNRTSRPLKNVTIEPDDENLPETVYIEVAPPRIEGEVGFKWGRNIDLSDRIFYDGDSIDIFVRIVTDAGYGISNAITKVSAMGTIIKTKEELERLEQEIIDSNK